MVIFEKIIKFLVIILYVIDYSYSVWMTSIEPEKPVWGWICTLIFFIGSIWALSKFTTEKGYYTNRRGEKVRYDSMTELAMMMHLDSCGCPWKKNTTLRIPYVFEGKKRKYIPDFLVDGEGFFYDIMIEIKGSNDRPELPFKVEAAEKYCEERKMIFSLKPYDEVRKLIDWKLVQEYHKNQENVI